MSAMGEQPEGEKPGKIRTWWHPLLANLLRWQLGSHYQLHEEFPVGKKPLQIDILLLQKEKGDLPERARAMLAGLVEYLNDYTLVELKSPSETLRPGDYRTLMAYTLLYLAQNVPTLEPSRMTLIVIAPRLTGPYADELKLLGGTRRALQDGIWRLEGASLGHPVFLLETEVLAGRGHPLLTLFSPYFLEHGEQTYVELRDAGYKELVQYMAQQIQQFRHRGEEFAMQHAGTEDEMDQAFREFLASLPLKDRLASLKPEELRQGLESDQALREFLASLPLKDRLASLTPEELRQGLESDQAMREFLASLPLKDRLASLTPEELRLALESNQALHDFLASVPPEERVEGLSPEQRLAGLSPEEREQLKELLQRQTRTNGSPSP